MCLVCLLLSAVVAHPFMCVFVLVFVVTRPVSSILVATCLFLLVALRVLGSLLFSLFPFFLLQHVSVSHPFYPFCDCLPFFYFIFHSCRNKFCT
uniref:Uncharacterized protein n=1 Tax=Ixodes ricinus TaxID=34613 RepID=A0A147BJ53_IXORI